MHARVCLGVLGLGRGLEDGVGVCGIVLVVVWGVFPSYNSTGISLPHLNNITDHNQRSTRHPPPLLCYQKTLPKAQRTRGLTSPYQSHLS